MNAVLHWDKLYIISGKSTTGQVVSSPFFINIKLTTHRIQGRLTLVVSFVSLGIPTRNKHPTPLNSLRFGDHKFFLLAPSLCCEISVMDCIFKFHPLHFLMHSTGKIRLVGILQLWSQIVFTSIHNSHKGWNKYHNETVNSS